MNRGLRVMKQELIGGLVLCLIGLGLTVRTAS